MVKDSFYRNMTDNQLQATYKEIEQSIKYDPSAGMIKEKEIIENVAAERGVTLGNKFDAVKGYIEFGMKK